MDFMYLLREATKSMWEELMGAKDYLDKYIEHHIESPSMARAYLELAPVELDHYNTIKKEFEKVVEANATELPVELLPIWDFEMSRLDPLVIDLEMRYQALKK